MRCSTGAGRFRLQLDWFNEREGRARENSEILTQLNGLSCLVQADFFLHLYVFCFIRKFLSSQALPFTYTLDFY